MDMINPGLLTELLYEDQPRLPPTRDSTNPNPPAASTPGSLDKNLAMRRARFSETTLMAAASAIQSTASGLSEKSPQGNLAAYKEIVTAMINVYIELSQILPNPEQQKKAKSGAAFLGAAYKAML